MKRRITSRSLSLRFTRGASVLACGLLAACGVSTEADPTAGETEAPVMGQLEHARQTLAARGLPIRLVGYAEAEPIDTEAAVGLVRADILDSQALVPQYDGVNAASFQLSTISDRMEAFRAGDDAQNVAANLQTMALPLIKLGQRTMDVTWEYAGRELQTKLVHDDSGLVYDNLLSNIALIDVHEVAEPAAPPSPAAAGPADGFGTFANQSFTARAVDIVITWVTGGTRGQVQIDHYVISCDNWVSFCDDGGVSNAWMSLGTAEGEFARNALIKPRISKMAWGYGWATPTASFSITFNTSTLTFSASTGGVGSAGKGTGIHSII